MKNIKKTNTKTKASKQLKLKTQIKVGYYIGLTVSAGADKGQQT